MQIVGDPIAAGVESPLLILLPGAHMTSRDFETRGFLDAVRCSDVPLNIVAAETGIDYYLDNNISSRIHEEVVLPALARGCQEIWLSGVSIGCMGALLYTQAHPRIVSGLILISPFLGTTRLMLDITRAGGLRTWQPQNLNGAGPEYKMLAWLRLHGTKGVSQPDIYLAYATSDRFVSGQRSLAALLPDARVVATKGGHDWDAWTKLWTMVMAITPFGTNK